MNYSEVEYYGLRTEDEPLIEESVALLPQLGPALFGTIQHVAQAHGLTLAQIKVVLQVATYGQMTMSEIACRLSVSMPAASEIVDRLVDAGHLVRASDPADRRRVLIDATPATVRLAEEVNDLRRAQLRVALGSLAPAERPSFVRSLWALLSGLTSDERIEQADCPVSVYTADNRDR
jgi:DNA-binding MarR family transcriptional regulator